MIKTSSNFYKELIKTFPFEATSTQNELLMMLSEFLFSKDSDAVFLLKGYAGTGKTSTISTLVNNLWKIGQKPVLLAPTGRAAKVISLYSKKQAFTIHKKIYHPKKNSNGGVEFTRQVNKHTNTVFFVDEASMVPDAPSNSKLFDNGSLLDDLMDYVYSGKNCKMILIGDTAQLPPVKLEVSPALNEDNLSFHYNKSVSLIELDEVMRQHKNSGILVNATELRMFISNDSFADFQFNLEYPDVVRLVDSYDIQDAIHTAYDQHGIDETAIVVRSNKRANQYNQQIRTRILDKENEISVGDHIMAVKNNYFWLKDSAEISFLANGDTFEVLEIFNTKELYGFRFAEVKIRLIDYPSHPPVETVLLLDTLMSESPSLSYEESNRLYQEVGKDYADIKSKYKKLLEIKQNKYFNAIQVKYSYAMTCHKSQGGQWDTVFIEKPYLPDGQSVDYWRWLYTAITRAKSKLYLLGFQNEDIEEL
ncbi:ATP-binding domain-containing protein [Flavicella sp.]|uniref:ATP-dependent DNA helicase n=1 Tax=Flavicella sp. TaxID=2957742 RepID=UPI002635F3CE|nr:ATP-binding domain-containing protein [Flavicella sp.]MDG1805974.1 AAA family ATPase [Flavicella sp.]